MQTRQFKPYLLLFCIQFLITAQVFAQTSAPAQGPPRVLSYQGYLTGADGKPAEGTRSITTTIYANEQGSVVLWKDTFEATILGGVFNLELGVKTPLPESQAIDKPLWLGISVEGQPELRPLTHLSATPYALNVADNSISSAKIQAGAITWDKIAAEYVPYIRVNGAKVNTNQASVNFTGADGVNLTYDTSTMSVVIHSATLPSDGKGSQGNGNAVQAHNGTSDYWGETGNNTTTPGTNYVGTSDNVALELHVNALRVMDYIPSTTSPNIIGGYFGNTIGTAAGSVIAGGGRSGFVNDIESNFGFIGSGKGNVIKLQSDYATVAGGESNSIDTADHSFIGGGTGNKIKLGGSIPGTDGDVASNSSIVGGSNNTAFDPNTFIGGGQSNIVGEENASIVGGISDTVLSPSSVIAGGYNNRIGVTNIESGSEQSFIGAGLSNRVDAISSVIVGGSTNLISSGANTSFIGGGFSNAVKTRSGAIGGGESNAILSGSTETDYHSAISGGKRDTILSSLSNIAGGFYNRIDTLAHYSAVGGGQFNRILPTASNSTISGGDSNTIDKGGAYSNVGGGRRNYIQGPFSVIAGGDSNSITNPGADHNVIGGGFNNEEDNPSFGVISGGWFNYLGVGAYSSTIGGGQYDSIEGIQSFIGGGSNNQIGAFENGAVIAGGDSNKVWGSNGFIGAGRHNFEHAPYGVLGGGYFDSTQSAYGFLGGGYKNHIDYNSDTAVLVGGSKNYINFGKYSFLGGGLRDTLASPTGVIVGGQNNKIDLNDVASSIIGGDSNLITNIGGPGPGAGCFIGGGQRNRIDASGINAGTDFTLSSAIVAGIANHTSEVASIIGAGENNLTMDDNDFIGAGISNTLGTGGTSAIASGQFNNASSAGFNGLGSNFIGAGDSNYIQSIRSAIVSGARDSILTEEAFIGGGLKNVITAYGLFGAIPGGIGLTSRSYAQFVAGRFNTPQGTSTSSGINGDDFLAIFGNGTKATATSDAFEVTNNGHSIVHHNIGNTTLAGPRPVFGGTYQDNALVGWADVRPSLPATPTGTITPTADFGIPIVLHPHTGLFIVCVVSGVGTTAQNFLNASVTATLEDLSTDPADSNMVCGNISASPMGVVPPASYAGVSLPLPLSANNWFIVRTKGSIDGAECTVADRPFLVHVYARPN